MIVGVDFKDDVLDYLPCSTVTQYKRGALIYTQNDPAQHLYLVVRGSVKAWRTFANGRSLIIGLYGPEDFFGESLLISPHRQEQATALEATDLMAWSAEVLEQHMLQRPKLAVALVRLFAKRTVEFSQGVNSCLTDTVIERLARKLIEFSDRWGVEGRSGSVEMAMLTHEFLSECVGSSRELITQYLN